ncbi:hypothetical protein PPUN12996_01640 [Pseudomonas putida]|nr:hypothetical protein PPUN12996_01640 [Pseudomonas putida]
MPKRPSIVASLLSVAAIFRGYLPQPRVSTRPRLPVEATGSLAGNPERRKNAYNAQRFLVRRTCVQSTPNLDTEKP